jgi:predicted nucleic acid-binding protein
MSTPGPRLFFDASALFAAIDSDTGAANALLCLAESGIISIIVSEQVIAETERSLARESPRSLPYYREALRIIGSNIVKDPLADEVEQHRGIIDHEADTPIIVAAMKVAPDLLVTHNSKRFIDDPEVARKSGLKIVAPREALAWVRDRLVPPE